MSELQKVESIDEKPEEEYSQVQTGQTQEPKIPQKVETQMIQQRRLSEIVQQAGEEEKKEEKPKAAYIEHVQPPVVKNPIFQYKGSEKYSWNIEMLDTIACIEKMQGKILPQVEQFPFLNDVDIQIKGTTNVKGHNYYNLLIKDKNGQRQVTRRYTEFILWRSKLTSLWPCLLLATLPNKTLIGISEADLISSRSKNINRFLRSISKYQPLYYSQECQNFFKDAPDFNLQIYLQSLAPLKSIQILQKYKTSFSEQYSYSQREEFMYRKQQVPAVLQEYEVYFTKKKIDLSDYLMNIRRMAESKQNYFRAVSKLNQTLLPDYQDYLHRWLYGEALPQQPPSILERVSLKSLRRNSIGNQNQVQPQGEQKEPQEPPKELQIKFGLYSTQAYKSRIQDTALLINDFNSSSWQIYTVVKYQLKQIDSVIGSIDQVKHVKREIQYIKRTMTINKEQIESLNNNKTTLKTFFMDGSKDEKKTKLVNQNQALEDQLQKLQELLNIFLVLLDRQFAQYNKERTQFYRKSVNKSLRDELNITRSITDFYIYEEQLFAKQQSQKLHLLKEKEQPQQKPQELQKS